MRRDAVSWAGATRQGTRLAAFLALLLCATPGHVMAATWTVCPSGCNSTTIQGAVLAADPGDTIQILSPGPHTEGDISLDKDIIVEGLGPETTIVQAAAAQHLATTPVFEVTSGSQVTMRSLTIRYGGGNYGGGVNIVNGDVALDNVDVLSNDAVLEGGGVYLASGSTLDASNSTISYNTADLGGGLRTQGSTELGDVEVSHNEARGDSLASDGGGIYSSGSLELRSCQVNYNKAYGTVDGGGRGGGLRHTGSSLLVSDSFFLSNEAVGDPGGVGGGLNVSGTGSATVSRTVIMLNDATIWGEGGGMSFSAAQLLMRDCTVAGNSAWIAGGLRLSPPEMGFAHLANSTVYSNHSDDGGGMTIRGPGATTLVNSTLSTNTANGNGGGIRVYSYEAGTVDIASTTITNNTADYDGNGSGNGGGLYVESGTSVGMRNTIVANNHDGSTLPAPRATDCSGTIESSGYNLIRSLGSPLPSCTVQGDTTGNLHSVDPLLLPYADNGGFTPTHALDTGSPAIDAGNPAGCTDPGGMLLLADQRHGFREDRCDIGAFEKSAVTFLIFIGDFELGSFSGWSKVVR